MLPAPMDPANPQLHQHLCQTLGVPAIASIQPIQSLWSGFGQIARVRRADANDSGGDSGGASGGNSGGNSGGDSGGVIIKHVKLPEQINHPRGWDTDRSAQRKIRSYEVETNWYAHFADRCPPSCRVPRHLGHAQWGDERLLILEDIDAAGFDQRLTDVTPKQLDACIRWLANFHATFLGQEHEGLWDKGTYWHLQTRPDEFEALDDGPLKRAAHAIDAALDASPFTTLVHGDAKPANFCLAQDGRVAAVDFQYVGPGCGMKDLAYLVGASLDPAACFAAEAHILDTYFTTLSAALSRQGSPIDRSHLEADWRRLYPHAWADFERFLQGWSPGHWKISPYTQHMTQQALDNL